MQWLIDIVSEGIRKYGMFVDRGDPTAYDFVVGDLTKDNTWRELDLSAIVPEHANAVLLFCSMGCDQIGSRLRFRRDGNTAVYNVSEIRLQIVGIINAQDLVCPISANRKLQYRASVAVWGTLDILVKGWWF